MKHPILKSSIEAAPQEMVQMALHGGEKQNQPMEGFIQSGQKN